MPAMRHTVEALPGGGAMSDVGLVLVGLAIATGIFGVVVPVLPGAVLVWAAILVWALAVGFGDRLDLLAARHRGDRRRPGREAAHARAGACATRASRAGRSSPVWCSPSIGFFVIPFVGFFIGFPLGVYLEERRRLGRHASAWASTQEALRAMGLSIVIELSATLVASAAWLAAVLI